MNVLANKDAIVSGASSGIGYATARRFVQQGAAVMVAARRQTKLNDQVVRITSQRSRALTIAGDILDEAFLKVLGRSRLTFMSTWTSPVTTQVYWAPWERYL